MKNVILFICFLLLGKVAIANVIPNPLFSDNAVFQQNIAVPIWGTADRNESITVSFAGQTVSTTATNGHWMVKLNPIKAGGPFVLVIQGKNTVTFSNILVGEVWICSGQSNMERQLGLRVGQKPLDNWKAEAAAANYPQIREFAVGKNPTPFPMSNLKGKWTVCDTATVVQFSAVGYFFGSELHKKLNVPIGLIHTSWGGTPAEKWTSRAALEANDELKQLVEAYDEAVYKYPEVLQKYRQTESDLLQKWVADTLVASENKKPVPQKPMPPADPLRSGDCGGLFNSMIHPLIPYAFKGVIWYQGESNSGRANQYQTLFSTMITDWRQQWNIGDFPFIFVQIAPFRTIVPELREAQVLTSQKTLNTAMVVTIDCGDTTDIHPTHKRPVGERLALAARALAYGEKEVVYSGPVYSGFKIMGNKVEISFTHTAKGLMAKEGNLFGFTISEDGKNFVSAKAEIKGKTVIVQSEMVKIPKAVRYAFINNANGNLFNSAGLPASPFRTDVD